MSLITQIREMIKTRFPAGSLRGRLASGAFWSIVGAILSRGSNLAIGLCVAHMLGRTDYGQLGMVMSTVGLFADYATLRLGLLVSRYLAAFHKTDPERAGRVLGLSTVIALFAGAIITGVALLSAGGLARQILNAPELAQAIQIGALYLLFEALNGAQRGALNGLEAFKVAAKIECFRGLLSFPAMLGGTYLFGLNGTVGGYALVSALGWLMYAIALRRELRRRHLRIHYGGIRSELPLLGSFGLPAFLSGMVMTPTLWIANVIMVRQPDGYDQLGLFNATRPLWGLMLLLPELLSQVNVPIMTDCYARRDFQKVRKILLAATTLNLAMLVPGAIVMSLLSTWIMSLYGPEFASGGLLLTVVLWAAVLASVQHPVGQIIIASSRMWLGLLLNALWAVTLLVAFLLMRDMAAMGLALAFVVAYLAHITWSTLVARRLMKQAGK